MMVIRPLFNAGRINSDIMMNELQYPGVVSMDKWKTYKLATWWIFLGFASLNMYGGWGLARGKDWSVVVRARVILWLTGPFAVIVFGLILPSVLISQTDGVDKQFIGPLIASIFTVTIWTTYLTKSKRVRNTYNKHDN
jgi:hypothetical protein